MTSHAPRPFARGAVGVALVLAVTRLPAQVTSTRSADPTTTRFGLLERVVSDEMRDRGIPGVALVIVERGEVRYRRGFGIADVESGAPMSPDLLVQVGSVTKVVTAMAAVDMALRGQVDLDAPVGRYITGLAPRIAALTLRALLTQSSGLRDEPADSGRQDLSALLEYARHLPDAAQQLPTGESFSYSNVGYSLGGLVLQEATHRPYGDLVETNVLRPLAMGHATMHPLDAATYPRAAGHAPDSTGRLRIVRPIANDTRYWPAGYLWASADDLADLLLNLMPTARPETTPKSLLAAMDSMLVPRVEVPGLPFDAHYGFGMFLDRWHGARRAWHPGSMPGHSSLIEFLPDHGLGVAIVANRVGIRLDRIAETALETLATLPGDSAHAEPREIPMADSVLATLTGTYLGRFPLELRLLGAQLLLRRFGSELPVLSLGGNRYAVQGPNGAGTDVFRIIPPAGARPAYIQMFLWAFPRVRR